MVDRNLFLHDLAIVAIFKDEAPYFKEWLDYHLLAGVEHFYLYNNDSSDDYKEILAPYVQAGLVTLTDIPGRLAQFVAYNDAIKRFKFFNRYMAFIDLDEFIYPKVDMGGGIISLIDEILLSNPHAAALGANWQIFGSNGHEKADYTRGVLERFTCRASNDGVFRTREGMKVGTVNIKTIANPRFVRSIANPHFAVYFSEKFAVNSNGEYISAWCNDPVLDDKIVINHYMTKSREEFLHKRKRGRATKAGSLDMHYFSVNDRNEVFDDGILKYRAARAEKFFLESGIDRFNRVTLALTKNLSAYTSGKVFSLETALTCRALSGYLRKNFPNDDDYWRSCEEAALGAILKSLDDIKLAEAQMFIRDLPNLLYLPYSAAKGIHSVALNLIEQIINISRMNDDWTTYVDLNYLRDLLKE